MAALHAVVGCKSGPVLPMRFTSTGAGTATPLASAVLIQSMAAYRTRTLKPGFADELPLPGWAGEDLQRTFAPVVAVAVAQHHLAARLSTCRAW